MKEKFEIVIERIKEANLSKELLCSDFWRKILRLQKNFTEEECWQLLKQNIEWVMNTHIMTTDDLVGWFSEEELNQREIYSKDRHEVVGCVCIGIKDAVIEASGHSRVVLFDKANCEAYDTSFVTGFNSSSFVVNDCHGVAMHNCHSQAKGFSIIESWSSIAPTKGRNAVVVRR